MICIPQRTFGGCLLVLLGTLLTIVLTSNLWLAAIGRWLAVTPQIGPANAIVVLAGGSERLVHGVTLYQQDWAPELWYTGNNSTSPIAELNEIHIARNFAIEQGVPAETIYLLQTTSTWEDGREIAEMIHVRKSHRILIVTNWYHSRRALCVIQRQVTPLGTKVFFSPAPGLRYSPEDWWQQEDGLVSVVNELIKFAFYWWRYGLVPWNC